MTVRNDPDYFKAHPQYHMYLHPQMPTWEQQMAARDRMLAAGSARATGQRLRWRVVRLGL
jgi:hypothetical protein